MKPDMRSNDFSQCVSHSLWLSPVSNRWRAERAACQGNLAHELVALNAYELDLQTHPLKDKHITRIMR